SAGPMVSDGDCPSVTDSGPSSANCGSTWTDTVGWSVHAMVGGSLYGLETAAACSTRGCQSVTRRREEIAATPATATYAADQPHICDRTETGTDRCCVATTDLPLGCSCAISRETTVTKTESRRFVWQSAGSPLKQAALQ